ncbi:hypothetical protein [Bacillus massilinigeriensis]|uniref:hypothetical protein n=1 Tax=Bacillus mediterraneensis TaxID=1805474 RepID=UPI0008F8B395|nr:hypothetical protein [Bacillus mediterraneensis]
MKKNMLLILLFLFALAGCGGANDDSKEREAEEREDIKQYVGKAKFIIKTANHEVKFKTKISTFAAEDPFLLDTEDFQQMMIDSSLDLEQLAKEIKDLDYKTDKLDDLDEVMYRMADELEYIASHYPDATNNNDAKMLTYVDESVEKFKGLSADASKKIEQLTNHIEASPAP